jgi:protein-S-isoprenylcysteine O-methyltransferase Ste14
MSSLELRVPPLAVVAIAAALMWFAATVMPAVRVEVPGRILLASALALAGGSICLAGILQFRRARTTINPLVPGASSALVTNGIYRFSRNPMYLGFTLLLGAWALLLQNPLNIAVLAAFAAYIDRFQIEPEERALEAKFGADFRAYRRAVRRWL